MSSKIYKSADSIFQCILPFDWEEYEDSENTYAFFNAVAWTGNLRITPLTEIANAKDDFADGFIIREHQERKESEFKHLGEFKTVYYIETSKSDNSIVHYWTIGKDKKLFICSFTVDAETTSASATEKELAIVENILKSIYVE